MGLSQELKVRNLSSGMSAKIKLAATLSRNAELYLLDEPLNGIDYKAREEIVNLILEEADGENTFVISTHLLEEIESFIEYAIFIKDGHLIDKINLEYLNYILMSDIFQSKILLKASGSTRKRISKSNLVNIEFKFTPLIDKQNDIVASIKNALDLLTM